MNIRSQSSTDARCAPRTYWLPTALLVFGLISIVMLVYTNRITERQRTNFAFANGLMDLQNHVAVFHLWFEESLSGDAGVRVEEAWSEMDSALPLAEAVLNGGRCEDGLVLEPLREPRLREEVGELGLLLAKFRDIALERSRDPENAGIGSRLDDEFDEVFRQFRRKAGAMELSIEGDEVANHSNWKRLFLGMVLAWMLIIGLATMGLWQMESRRNATEAALQSANDRLESQAEELERHRLHLIELVEERTADLKAANDILQLEVLERKKAVDALQTSRDRFEKLSLEFHTLLDAIPDSLTLLSPELRVLWANRAAASFCSKPASELVGQRCRRLMGDPSNPCNNCPAIKAFQTGRAESAEISGQDGSIWDVRAFPIKDGEGRVMNVIEIIMDVTEKMTLQAEAQRMAHLASLGELAAGVAHEINNPINSVINCAQILIDDFNPTDEERDILGRVVKEGRRIATIVRSLLSFARTSKAEKTGTHIHEIVSEALALTGRQLEKEGIITTVSVPEDLPLVAANAQQIEQVFVNLISNARYALNLKYPGTDEGKRLDIQGERMTVLGTPYVSITLHDRGAGIHPDIMSRVRDPFFSTKPKGIGTGLGLSISHGIISDHGGKLIIHSQEREFTRVQILLPSGERNAGQSPSD